MRAYLSSMTIEEATNSKTQNRETSQGRTAQRNQTNQAKKQATPRGKTNTTEKEEPQAPTKTKDHKAGRQSPTRRGRGGGGDKRRPARKERADAREGSRTGGRKQHKPRRRARAALAVSEGYSGSHEGNCLSDGARGTGTTPTTWCRGQSPTQGRSLCCQEAE